MSKAVFSRERIAGVAVLVPTDEDGRLLLASWPLHRQVMLELHPARNPRHHRLLFAVYVKLSEAGVFDGDQEAFLDWCKFAAGHIRTTIDHLGKPHLVPKSISFEKMHQAAFVVFFDRVMQTVTERLLNGDTLAGERLRKEVLSMVDQGYMGMRR